MYYQSRYRGVLIMNKQQKEVLVKALEEALLKVLLSMPTEDIKKLDFFTYKR